MTILDRKHVSITVIPFCLTTTSIVTAIFMRPLKILIGSYAELNVDSRSCSYAGSNLKYRLRLLLSGVTRGGKGGHLFPGAALWGRQIEVGMLRVNYEVSNVERMLIITINKMSTVIAKSNQDHQGSQSEKL